MKTLIIVLLLALLFISQINTVVDTDLWGILAAGRHIIKNLEIPHTDIFSYALEGRAWIDHEWLTQILFYPIFLKFGWMGLNILQAFVISACFLILFSLASGGYRKILFPVFFILLSVLAYGYRSFLRPEIFSYLFLCIFLYILEREKRIYLLPILQVLWVNLHGYFILGPLVVFLYCAGGFFEGDRNKARRLTFVFAGTVLACFVNPYFYKGALYPLKTLIGIFTEQRLFTQNVHELMMPVKANFRRYVFYWLLAIASSISFILNIKNVKIRHILLFAISFLASYLAVRNMPLFIFVAMPLAAINFNGANLTRDLPERRYYALTALVICGLLYFFLSDGYYEFTKQSVFRKTGSGFSELLVPSGACDFLEDNNIQGRIFNTLDFGPYIAYRFYPEKRIFIDPRTEVYKDDFYILYRKAQNYPGEWRRLQEIYGFRIVLLRHLFGGTERMLRYLYKETDWKLVYYDENSCVFLSNVNENAQFIDRFEIDFSAKRLLEPDFNINVARFFEKIGEADLAEGVYIKLLEGNPKFLEAANNLASIYINSGRFEDGLKLIQRFLTYYPEAAELYANMGIAYLRLGMREKAVMMLEKAARIDPYLRKASYIMGLVYFERGDIDRAMRQFIKYLKLDPYNPEVHRLLGDIYAQKVLLKKAELEYNEAEALEGLD